MDGQLARAVTFDGAAASVSRRNWLEPMLLALVLTLWFGYELGTRALWAPDEGRYAEIAREMAASGDFVTPRLDGVPYLEKPPLVYWLTAGTMRLFGISEWTARAWPAIFALAGCLVAYFAGRGLYGRRAGLIAAAILALCPLYDFLGRSLTLDMALTAWLTAALSAFLFAARDPDARHRRWLYYAFYVAIAFAVLTKGIVALAIPAMVIGAWIALMGEWRLIGRMHLPAGFIIVGAIAGPWHVLAEQANPGFSHFYFVHEHFARFLTTVHHRVQPAWFFVPVIVVGFFPWSAFLPAALRGLRWRERREHREAWFLVLWAAIPFLFFSLSGSKLVPYVLPVLPPLALLLGDRLARAWERNEAPPRAALWALLAMGVSFSAVFAALPTLDSSSTTLRSAVEQLGNGFYLLAALWTIAAAAPWLAERLRRPRVAWLLVGLGSATLLVGFETALARLDVGRSVKSLAVALAPRLGPTDEVMNYEAYYQDLPVYLRRRITLVEWTGELEYGMTLADTSAWMIDVDEFRRRWIEPRPIYLFVSRGDYPKLLAKRYGPHCEIDSSSRVLVLTNRACAP